MLYKEPELCAVLQTLCVQLLNRTRVWLFVSFLQLRVCVWNFISVYVSIISCSCVYVSITSCSCVYVSITSCSCVYVSITSCSCVYVSITSCSCVYVSITSCSSVYVSITSCSSVYVSITSCSSVYVSITSCSSVYVSITSCSCVYVSITSCSSVYVSITSCSSVYVSITSRSSVYVSITSRSSVYVSKTSRSSVYVPAAASMARLHWCVGLFEPLLFTCLISTAFLWAGSCMAVCSLYLFTDHWKENDWVEKLKLCLVIGFVIDSLGVSHLMTNPTMWLCVQRRLRSAWASAQSDQSSLSVWWKLGSLATHWAQSVNSDQTGRIPRLIWVFAGCTVTSLVLTWGGSILGTSGYQISAVNDDSMWFRDGHPLMKHNYWATARQNQQNDLCAQRRLRSVCISTWSDQSSLSAWRSIGSLATHWVHSEVWSDWTDAQADQSLCWVHRTYFWFCHAAAHIALDVFHYHWNIAVKWRGSQCEELFCYLLNASVNRNRFCSEKWEPQHLKYRPTFIVTFYGLLGSDIVSETKVWLKEGMSDVFLKSVSSQCARSKSSAGEKRMSIPKFLSGKNFFKNVILQIFNFILVS